MIFAVCNALGWLACFPAGRQPLMTFAAVGVALVAAVVQYSLPAAVPALQRDPAALAAGEWWRAVTPLLVQTLGWSQLLANLVGFVVVGAAAEWVLGRGRWLAFLLAGAAGGQVAAYVWVEPGGGSSIAICGLAGGVAVSVLWRPPNRSRGLLACLVVWSYVAALTGWGFGGPLLAGLAGTAAAAGYIGVRLRVWASLAAGRPLWRRGPLVDRAAAAGVVACAIALAAVRDLHGAALISAVVFAVLTVMVVGVRG